MKIDWQDMNVEKASMLGLFNAKYIQSSDNYNYPFMLCMGKDRHRNNKLYLIECITNDYKMYLCKSEAECDDTAFNIILYLIRNGRIIDFFNEKEQLF